MQAPAFPKRIEIELVSACNLRCIYCPRRFVGDLHGFMEADLFYRLLNEAAEHPETIIVLHRRGESLLHPRFGQMLDAVRGRFRTVQLATNATLLDSARAEAILNAVSFLSFSIDTPERYEQVRPPARYADVAANIDRFLEMNAERGHPVATQVSMVRTADASPQDIDRFVHLWSGRADRVRIYDAHSMDGRFGSLEKGRGRRMPCVMPFYEMLIYYDGAIGRCNHDWDSEPIGDLRSQGIAEIWHSPIYDDLRQQHRQMTLQDRVCRTCDSWYAEEGRPGTGKVVQR
jgi:radical SAM protein with 4Fe4S-binding SPASM domain